MAPKSPRGRLPTLNQKPSDLGVDGPSQEMGAEGFDLTHQWRLMCSPCLKQSLLPTGFSGVTESNWQSMVETFYDEKPLSVPFTYFGSPAQFKIWMLKCPRHLEGWVPARVPAQVPAPSPDRLCLCRRKVLSLWLLLKV